MSSRFPRAYRQQLAATDAANVERAIGRNTYDEAYGPQLERRYGHRQFVPTATDSRRLRGIPAIGPGVTGATPNTRPGWNL